MSASVREISLQTSVETYLDKGMEFTLLGQAFLALTDKKYRESNKSELAQNVVYKTLKEFISFAHGQVVWKKEPVIFGDKDIRDQRTLNYAVERHIALAQPLYQIADIILAQESLPIDKHDIEHIRRNLTHVEALLQLMFTHTDKEISHELELTAKSSVVQHDVGLGITGREHIPHELIGSTLTPYMVAVEKGTQSNELSSLPAKVATNTLRHVTRSYAYQEVKDKDFSPAYALTVLSDELDVSRLRSTERNKQRMLSGEKDRWFFMNYFTSNVICEWDEQNNVPKIVFTSFSEDPLSEKMHRDFILRSTGFNVIPGKNDFQSYYRDTFLHLLLNPTKVNLFKNALRSLFDTKGYTVTLKTKTGKVFFDMNIQ